jgi:hypothetical protein
MSRSHCWLTHAVWAFFWLSQQKYRLRGAPFPWEMWKECNVGQPATVMSHILWILLPE